MRGLAPVHDDQPQRPGILVVSDRRARVSRGGERRASGDLEVPDSERVVDEIRKAANRLGFAVATVGDGPSEDQRAVLHSRHAHPRRGSRTPCKRWPIGRRQNGPIDDLYTHRRPLLREKVRVHSRDHTLARCLHHVRNRFAPSTPANSLRRTKNCEAQITSIHHASLNQMHGPRPTRSPQISILDASGECDTPNRVRGEQRARSVGQYQLQPRRSVRRSAPERECRADNRDEPPADGAPVCYTLATPTQPRRDFVTRTAATLALIFLCLSTAPASAQTPGPDAGDGVRFGISMGGISTIGLTVEFFQDSRSLDLTLGTWRFRDVSFSAVAKQYFGAGSARPVVGLGLWTVAAKPDERTGLSLVLRAPIGVDWEVSDPHSIGAFLNVNRGLWVRRSDPADTAPMNKRLVPLPELYYRVAR